MRTITVVEFVKEKTKQVSTHDLLFAGKVDNTTRRRTSLSMARQPARARELLEASDGWSVRVIWGKTEQKQLGSFPILGKVALARGEQTAAAILPFPATPELPHPAAPPEPYFPIRRVELPVTYTPLRFPAIFCASAMRRLIGSCFTNCAAS